MTENHELIDEIFNKCKQHGYTDKEVRDSIECALVLGKTLGFKAGITRAQNKLTKSGINIDLKELVYSK